VIRPIRFIAAALPKEVTGKGIQADLAEAAEYTRI
jgi:hypothetical protein